LDLKNACNSFLNAVQVAESLILAGAYRKVLIAVGEIPSRGTRWSVSDRAAFKRSFLGYTLGDAGAAALLTPSANGPGILHCSFKTVSRHWNIATVAGGGTMHPRGDEFSYLEGDGNELQRVFEEIGPSLLLDALKATGTQATDYRRILVHQVSVPALNSFLEISGVPGDRVVVTVPQLGNMVAASMPVGFALAEERGEISRGDLLMWIGLAAGASLGIILMQY